MQAEPRQPRCVQLGYTSCARIWYDCCGGIRPPHRASQAWIAKWVTMPTGTQVPQAIHESILSPAIVKQIEELSLSSGVSVNELRERLLQSSLLTPEQRAALWQGAGAEPHEEESRLQAHMDAMAEQIRQGQIARNQPALEMLRRWAAEDAKMTPEEVAKADADLEALIAALAANRLSFRDPD